MQMADFCAMTACATDLTASLVAMGTDIALLIDDAGVVYQLAQSGRHPMSPAAADWIGQRWSDTVTAGTRAKIERMLAEVRCDSLGVRREVNHSQLAGGPRGDGGELPVAYSTMRMGPGGPVLAIGRDLRSWVAAQSLMLSGQRVLERDYWHNRQSAQAQAQRDRWLQQALAQPAVVVCASSNRLLDVNDAAMPWMAAPAATEWQPGTREGWRDRPAQQLFDNQSWPSVRLLLQTARPGHRVASLPVRLAHSHRSAQVSVLVPPGGDGDRRLLHLEIAGPREHDQAEGQVGALVTEGSGRILCANPTLLRWLGLPHEHALRGQPLSDWIDQGDAGARQLLQSVARLGLVRDVGLEFRAGRATVSVQVAAHLLGGDESAVFGFVLRRPGHHACLSEVITR
jgi:PAS domain-containing protein